MNNEERWLWRQTGSKTWLHRFLASHLKPLRLTSVMREMETMVILPVTAVSGGLATRGGCDLHVQVPRTRRGDSPRPPVHA